VNIPADAVENWVTQPETGFTAPAHRGAVNCIAVDEAGLILSGGDDGFLVIWDEPARTARERFQLSPYSIEKIVPRPGKREIAVYESDGVGFYRVSVWDYAEKERRFILPLTNPVLYCGYTAQGTNLVLGFSSGIALFDGKTGEQRGERLGDSPVTLAISSRTERTLQTYSSSGVLAYWDLDKSNLSLSFSIPANLRTPLVFGSYRFLAGQNNNGLFVIDAVSGKTFFEAEAVPGSVLLCDNDSGASFFRVSPVDEKNGGVVLKREYFTVAQNGDVERGETFVNMDAEFSVAASFNMRHFLVGSNDGRLAFIEDGLREAAFFLFKNQTRLLDAASSPDGAIVFTDENGYGAFIPADGLGTLDSINLFAADSLNRVSSGGGNSFLLWHYGGEPAFTGLGHIFPVVKTFNGISGGYGAADDHVIDDSDSFRPLRSAAISGEKVLFLDISGGIKIFSLEDGRRLFSYTSALSLDALFVDERNILIARNAEAGRGASPFLLVDTVSGETLPAAYPVSMVFMLFKSRENNIYSAALTSAGRQIKTKVLRFDTRHPESSSVVFEYNGEDTDFSFIEYGAPAGGALTGGGGRFAGTTGGEGAFIILGDGATLNARIEPRNVDRAPAFPQKLLPQNGNFAALDVDGTISWYDGVSGRLLAMLRFYENEWLLSTPAGTKRGKLTK
jgi:WD40 repeat protein